MRRAQREHIAEMGLARACEQSGEILVSKKSGVALMHPNLVMVVVVVNAVSKRIPFLGFSKSYTNGSGST